MEIVKMIFGSHLYGTNTPESDSDYKGVFLPSKRDVFLGEIKKSIPENTKKDCTAKNTCNDIDTEMYSLHYFLKMGCNGETAVLDMVHAPSNMIISNSMIWQEIVKERHRFYTKNLTALIGYARRQASKYGVKGSRLNDAKTVLNFCKGIEFGEVKLKSVWDSLPSGEHIFIHKATPKNNNLRMYEVCGRKISESCSISQLQDIIGKFYKAYGERARKAASDEGVDWKAVSHALRAAYQIKQILTENTITFPLERAELLREIKTGKWRFKHVQEILEALMVEVEELSKASTLPEKVDKEYWDNFLIDVCEEYLK